MAKIEIQEPNGPYSCEVNTDLMQVTIRNAFLGIRFVTEEGEELAVSMRDGGFELHYKGDFGEQGFNAGWFFKDGVCTKKGNI